MHTGINSNHYKQHFFLNRRQKNSSILPHSHEERVRQDLLRLGVSRFGLRRLASRYLPAVIHRNEQIGGVVYGSSDVGSVMLVATDQRVIYLDKKPFFINEDELTYDVVSGVSFSHAGPGSSLTLHTRVKDYTIHTLNTKAAKIFIHYIELRCLEHTQGEARR